jgi:hypothetical protein
MKPNKLESIEDRLREIERILIGKGHMRASTKQGKAIAFVIEHQAELEKLIKASELKIAA